MRMKTITKLDIPDEVIYTLAAKVRKSNPTISKLYLYNITDFVEEKLQEAYQVGLDQGTIEALKVIKEELLEE